MGNLLAFILHVPGHVLANREYKVCENWWLLGLADIVSPGFDPGGCLFSLIFSPHIYTYQYNGQQGSVVYYLWFHSIASILCIECLLLFTHISCCVTVQNIGRCLYFLPRIKVCGWVFVCVGVLPEID